MKKNLLTNKTTSPLVSVVMPVFNAAPYIKDCVESILNQTHSNLEFIIVDDASTDATPLILSSVAKIDRRIKLFRNESQRGISITVKLAINKAKGDYIARMDADDISLPERLAKQVAYLEKNKKTVALGTQCLLIDKNNKVTGKKTFPTKHEDIYKYVFHFVPLQQPTLVIARHRLPKNFEFYQDGMNTAEEVELFFKLFQYGKIENLDEYLFKYRIHGENTSLKNIRRTFILTLISRLKATIKYNYRPTFSGVVMTIAQAMIVLILPQRITLFLYKLSRSMFSFNPSSLLPGKIAYSRKASRA